MNGPERRMDLGGLSATPLSRNRRERPVRRRPGKNIRSWDFRNPDKFSKEHLRSLHSLQQNFARIAATVLSGRLRSLVTFKVAVLEQGLFEEYTELLPERSLVSVIALKPLDGNVALEIPHDLALAMLERLLGGQDRADGYLDRELTDIEFALLGNLVQSLLEALREAWADVIDLEPMLQNTTTSRQLGQIVPPGDSVLIAFFDVLIGTRAGAMTLCIPHLMLEPVTQALASQAWSSSGRLTGVSAATQSVLETHVRRTRLSVTAVLGETDVPMEELARLQEGDLLLLGNGPQPTARLRVVNRYLFSGRPGLAGGRLAVKIERTEDPDALN